MTTVKGASNYFSQFNYTFITEDIGLPNNFVENLYKDSEGYLWISTHNGLSRYDGYSFLSFNTISPQIKLKGDVIYKVCEDIHKRLWVASEGGIDIIDLHTYDNVNLNLTKYSPLWNLMNTHVTNVYKDKRGNMWISVLNTLYCITFDDNGAIKDYYSLEKGVSESVITCVIELEWGICANINNSLQLVETSKDHILKCKSLSSLTNNIRNDWKIECMAVKNNILWIGTNNGLYRYDHFNQHIQRFTHSPSDKGSISQSYVTDIKFDHEGKMFISTLNGLNVYNSNGTFSYIRQDNEFKNHSLNCNFINCILIDKNRLWVGTEIGGINLLTPSRLHTNTWQNSKKDASSLSPNPVNAINMDRNGNLWVGTIEGGLNLKRKGSNTFQHFINDEKDPHSISHNSVCGILIDKDNHLWAYTWGQGINELDLNQKNYNFTRYYREITPGLEGNFISSACEDLVNNGIWFGSSDGLHFFDKTKKSFIVVRFNIPDNHFETIRGLFIDNKNRLWIGTSNGLFIIDLFSFARSHKHFDYKYIRKLSDSESNMTDKINCIIQDKDNNIWLGGDGCGLYRLKEEKNGQFFFTNYTSSNGLPNNNVIGILEDKNKFLWISTNQGISKFDKKKNTFTNFSKYDGLLNNQFYWNAYYYSPTDNILYFGNIEGLIEIYPDNQKNLSDNIKVSITGFQIQGKYIYPSSGSYLDNNITSSKEINLHEKDHSIEIDFSAKDYVYNSQIKYAYRLEGYEKEWNETKRGEHSAKYTSIPAGDYVFQVRATDDKGNWSDQITELEIHVSPHFYKSYWFFCIIVILIIACARWFYLLKTNAYIHQKNILEDTVKQRTSELAVQNKKLIEMSRKLAETTEEKITFFTNITHEFRTPVTLINGPIEQAIKYNNDEKVNQQLKLAERSSKYLLALVNELMDFRKIDSQKVQLEKRCSNFKDFIDNTIIPFKAFAGDRNITLTTFDHINNEYIILDYEYIKKVMVNLISNAIKFTPNNGKINVYFASVTHKQHPYLYIAVEDTGAGIEEKDLSKIFDRFYQSKKSIKYPVQGQSSTGIGLYLCKKIVELHHGEIYAVNNKNGGASIRLFIPLKNGDKCDEEIKEEKEIEIKTELNPNIVQGETILIVDDNDDMRIYVRALLQSTYNIIEASDGSEALAIITTRPPDLIISDIMMPVMNGIELSRRVKENISVSHIPFLMLTAIVSEEQKKESYEIGVDEYLCKPFDEDILLLKIRNIFSIQQKYKARFAVTMNSDNIHILQESKDKQFLDKAISIMKNNYSNATYDIDSFVSELGFSKTLVNNKLQALIGQTTGQFMKNYRLNNAHEYLISSSETYDINISEIAYKVGFNDPKYFSKCFKELYGVLPSSLLTKK